MLMATPVTGCFAQMRLQVNLSKSHGLCNVHTPKLVFALAMLDSRKYVLSHECVIGDNEIKTGDVVLGENSVESQSGIIR